MQISLCKNPESCSAAAVPESAFLEGSRQWAWLIISTPRWRSLAAKKLSNDQRLAFYACYKQVNSGDCNTGRPGFFDPVGGAKW